MPLPVKASRSAKSKPIAVAKPVRLRALGWMLLRAVATGERVAPPLEPVGIAVALRDLSAGLPASPVAAERQALERLWRKAVPTQPRRSKRLPKSPTRATS